MTDVKTGWTVHFALMNKAAVWIEQIQACYATLPLVFILTI
jgi:hypothetical protein